MVLRVAAVHSDTENVPEVARAVDAAACNIRLLLESKDIQRILSKSASDTCQVKFQC